MTVTILALIASVCHHLLYLYVQVVLYLYIKQLFLKFCRPVRAYGQ